MNGSHYTRLGSVVVIPVWQVISVCALHFHRYGEEMRSGGQVQYSGTPNEDGLRWIHCWMDGGRDIRKNAIPEITDRKSEMTSQQHNGKGSAHMHGAH